MLLFLKRYSKTILDIGILIGIIIFVMWIGELIFKIATPIVFGYFIFLIIEPMNRFFTRKGMKRSIATLISLIIFLLIILGVIFILGVVFVTQAEMIIENVNEYFTNFEEYATKNITIIQEQINKLPPKAVEKINSTISTVGSSLLEFSTRMLKSVLGSVSSISVMSIKFILGIILAFFLSVEIEELKEFASNNTPKTFKEAYYFLKVKVLSDLGKYIKAQFKLILITFVIVFFGLMILGVKNSFTLAIISAIFDVLPLLGISTIFVPWIIYTFLVNGSTVLGIGLTILWLVVVIFRQFAEPKIVGDSLDISAFFMLSAMTIFLSIFGLAGVILTPVLIILIKELYTNGYLSRWIRKPEDEY